MLLRAEKSVANGTLTVITLLAIGVAGAATLRGFGPETAAAHPAKTRSPPPMTAALPALSCIDDLAGDTVLTACEKALFGSAEATAAALSYAASQITRLTAFGDAAAAQNLTPETAGAAPGGRARPLRVDGLCAAGARPLHAVGLRGFPVADQSPATRVQYG